MRDGARCSRLELEFLPAALELERTPPNPVGRAIVWTIVALFGAAAVWSVYGRLDIVAVARGKLVPSGRVKTVQSLETGVVKRILVAEGDVVVKGQVLIDLDTTIARADRDRVAAELLATRLEVARVRATIGSMRANGAVPALAAPHAASSAQIALQAARVNADHAAYRAGLERLVHEERRRRAERAASVARIERLDAVVPILTEQAGGLAQLAARALAPRTQWLDIERQRIEQDKERAVQAGELAMIDASIAALGAERASFQARFEADRLEELARFEARAAALEKDLVKARQRRLHQSLRAPAAGVVQQLAMHTVGGVVKPAEVLMVIVPAGAPLLVEAWIRNQDIGFVREHQRAVVKIDAFPFTRYGTIGAEIVNISDDAVPDERLGLVYAAELALDETRLDVDGKWVGLSPGMGVSAEVKTGRRRVVEFLLGPLMRGLHESARER